MKTLFVLVGVCIVVSEGLISNYRTTKSKRHQDLEDDSYEEDYSDFSLEELEDNAPQYDRRMRASVYQPSYGYSKSYRRKYDREDEVKFRKPKYTAERSRGKYLSYEKGPHKTLKKNFVPKHMSSTPEVGDRKKDHRSAPVYEPSYHYPSPPPPPPPPSYSSQPSSYSSPQSSYSSPPASVPYSKLAPPKAQCNQQLLISCTPTVTKVCMGPDFGKYHPAPQHVPEVPDYEAPAYHAPEHAYSAPSVPAPAYSRPPVPAPAYSPHPVPAPAYSPTVPQYQAPSKPSYHHQPVQPEPVHRPLYHKPGQHPYYQSKPESHYPAPPAYHQPYQPTYKSNEQAPSFAAPVSEDNEEPGVKPFVSAFRTATTTTTTTQRVPAVPVDKDQTIPNTKQRAQNADEEGHNMKEGSGDEPEPVPEPAMVAAPAPVTTSTTPAPQPSTTPSKDEKAQR